MIDCKNYRLAAFALSERKLTGLIPDAYPSQTSWGKLIDPRQALTEAYIHELQDLENMLVAFIAAAENLKWQRIRYLHPHGYICKMYSEFFDEQGGAKQADETLSSGILVQSLENIEVRI